MFFFREVVEVSTLLGSRSRCNWRGGNFTTTDQKHGTWNFHPSPRTHQELKKLMTPENVLEHSTFTP